MAYSDDTDVDARPAPKMADPYNAETIKRVCRRVLELREQNSDQLRMRAKVRDIMNGGPKAVAALLGNKVRDPDMGMPVANLMLSAGTRLGQKLGRRPDIKVDPPLESDSDGAVKGAEKRARIVETHDRVSSMDLQFPQLGRWVPGYGFHAWVLRQGRDANGDPYPLAEMRDPYETYPSEWGIGQQPRDIAFCRLIGLPSLLEMYPQYREQLAPNSKAGSAILLDQFSASGADRKGWSSQAGTGIEIYEYVNRQGTWWVVPDKCLLLSYVPNLLASSPFRVVKRFSFDQLTGQYDHIIGLMANIARLNLLATIATEDSVMAETNIVGDLAQGDVYRRGRNAVNFFTPGSQIAKNNSRVPFEAFQQADRIERQLRLVAGYPVTDDGQSPNSFVTGRGLEELGAAVSAEVSEYQLSFSHALVELDALRLEWDEKYYGRRTKRMYGMREGASYSETYTPAVHIKGNYLTRRVYGAMSGFDEPTKIVTGLQLMQAEIIDGDTMRENIAGLENHSKIKERIRAEKAEKVTFDTLLAMAQNGDQRAMAAVIDLLPATSMKDKLTELFLAQPEPQPTVEQQMAPPGAAAPPPDVQSVLTRLTAGGGVEGGVQTVGQVA
jgi:hypothetical protein